jgi:ATP-dependent RNA helicase HelY
LTLTSLEEETLIREIVEQHCASLNDDDRLALEFDDFVDDVSSGVACHHAGMIPMFKESIEECFVRGLIKVVFATETLAVGINMPARAVVIEKLTKYTGEHHQLLRASEFTQLTGRAGRRGLDDIGHAITLWNPFVSFDQVAGLALSRSFRLSSAFRPTFNMAANMVRRHSQSGTHHILNLSFAQFQADKDVVTAEATLERRRRDLALLERTEREPEWTDDEAQPEASDVEVQIALRSLRPGDVVIFDAANIRGRGLVLSTAARRNGIRLTVLTPTRKTIDVTSKDLRSIPVRGARIDLPVPFEPSRTEFVKEAVNRLVRARVDDLPQRPVGASYGDRHRESPISSNAIKRLRKEVEQLEQRKKSRSGSVGARFMDVIDLLEDRGCVRDWNLTEKGSVLAGIFHESDLLIVEVMDKGILDNLSVPDLVAVLSTLVFEPRGGDSSSQTNWPSDTVRQRFKRIERTSVALQEEERQRGLQVHRPPHGGLAWETFRWAQGRPLSRILDADLTPGDFVRSMRQLIDLLRQIANTTLDDSLRASADSAISAIDRGVVSAAQGVTIP